MSGTDQEIRQLSIWELYFTGRGRLSSKDFGMYYIVLSLLMFGVAVFISFMGGNKPDFENQSIFSPVSICIILVMPMTIMALGKRARDANYPIWLGLLPLLFLGLFASSPTVFPFMQDIVYKFFDSSSGVGMGITIGFWMMKAVDDSNFYGPPCKVVMFKRKNSA